ncbi:MAG: DUF6875 domain-containing protein [Endozoicomonas sp.]|uniref:DUF6875 domain-containing protein n=1 Tax=Endozoicomonas sp. TaxID=1892382 RepID=UPI003D9AECBD
MIWDLSEEPQHPDAESLYPAIRDYISEFLVLDHPFRKGKVCPYAPAAIKQKNIFFSYAGSQTIKNTENLIEKSINEWQKKKDSGLFSALIIMLPAEFSLKSLLQIQRKKKIKYVKKQLMIGATYSINQSPSIHCSSYYPLRTETPCLIVRPLTVDDLVFLNPKHYSVLNRIKFLEKFVEKFEEKKSERIEKQVNTAKSLILSYKHKLLTRNLVISISLALALPLTFFLTKL